MHTIRRLAMALVALATIGLAAVGFDVQPAAATPVACSGMNNGVYVTSGWFDSGNSAVNCSIDGNHIKVDLYGPGGTAYWNGVYEIWVPDNCFAQFAGGTDGAFGGLWYFKVSLIPNANGLPCSHNASHSASRFHEYLSCAGGTPFCDGSGLSTLNFTRVPGCYSSGLAPAVSSYNLRPRGTGWPSMPSRNAGYAFFRLHSFNPTTGCLDASPYGRLEHRITWAS